MKASRRQPDAEFEARLSGGHPNSLGNTVEVVDEVLADPPKFDRLFRCYFSNDEVVRLRVSNGVKRVTKAQPAVVEPYVDRLLTEISQIDQPSTQWTLAELFALLWASMNAQQRAAAHSIVLQNLQTATDWIVLNKSIDSLIRWHEEFPADGETLVNRLKELAGDRRRSVSARAKKALAKLGDA